MSLPRPFIGDIADNGTVNMTKARELVREGMNAATPSERESTMRLAMYHAQRASRFAIDLECRLSEIVGNTAEPEGPRIVRADFGARPRPVINEPTDPAA